MDVLRRRISPNSAAGRSCRVEGSPQVLSRTEQDKVIGSSPATVQPTASRDFHALSLQARRGQPTFVVVTIYAALVLLMWAPYTALSGLPFETAFPYMSETSSAIEGFFYRGDPLRIHTNTFYHLSYLLAEALGVGGSYVPYQIVHALLWWGRGFLVFLILRRLSPQCVTVAYVAGALVLVHAADGAIQWVGQMNQFGFIFWMLLAWYLLTIAADQKRLPAGLVFGAVACLAAYMSLWSYESQLILLMAFPLVAWIRLSVNPRRLLLLSAAWYVVPFTYLWLTIAKYLHSNGNTYQESVVRHTWVATDVLADWWFNIAASLEFWKWRPSPLPAPTPHVIGYSAVAAAAFAAGVVLVARTAGERDRRSFLVASSTTWVLVATGGFTLLALSFPVYLLLESARGLWRTQLLSGPGAGLMLCAVPGLLLTRARFLSDSTKLAIYVAASAAVVYFGSFAAIQKGSLHRLVWERHRAAIIHVLEVAPSVKPDTIIILINVPKDPDPFGHNMWLDLAARLIYPGTRVAAAYFYDDGTPSPGHNLKVDDDRWKWDGTAFPTDVHDASIANTVVVDFKARGPDALVKVMPAFICRSVCNTALYNPAARLTGSTPLRVIRRYRVQATSTDATSTDRIPVMVATYGANSAAARGNSTSRLARACDERDRCIYKVDVEVLGDPAPNCAKDFVVE
jgi:hypothetical protein